ncbi:AIPR family protein, partial [Geminicoccus harenae]
SRVHIPSFHHSRSGSATHSQTGSEQNDTGEIAFTRVLSQENFYNTLTQGAQGSPINITINLFEWAQKEQPMRAYYGQVAASDVADWYNKHQPRLFSRNIRSFLGSNTSVNESICASLQNNPEIFWYLNNGITALCGSIRKRAIGGTTRDAGQFDCTDVTIVNGAQTVGSISSMSKTDPESLNSARVPIRLISLEGCPEDFAIQVTRATNTQNRVDSRNFVALDPEQERLRNELQIEGIDYEFRQGEIEGAGPTRFGLVEATIALACSRQSVDLAVQAKREISKLWDDLSKAPYKTLFHSGLSGPNLWQRVQFLREMEKALEEQRQIFEGRSAHVAIHGNRIVEYLAFKMINDAQKKNQRVTLDDINAFTKRVLKCVIECTENNYPDSYIASLYKNATKCKVIVDDAANHLSIT